MNIWKLFVCFSSVWLYSLSSIVCAQSKDSSSAIHYIDSASIVLIVDSNSVCLTYSPISVDTSFENYRYYFFKGQIPEYDVLISRIKTVDTIPFADDYRIGFDNFSNFMNLKTNNLKIDTSKSLSRLSLILGSKREQLLFLDHKQKFGNRVIAGLFYNSIVSEGFLNHQFGKAKAFGLSFDYTSKKYLLLLNYYYHKVEAEENGGIAPNQEIGNLSKSDYGTLKTNLSDGLTNLKSHKVEINHTFLISKAHAKNQNDSIYNPRIFVGLNSTLYLFGHSYFGTSDSSFYANSFIDSDSTKDTTSFVEIRNNIFLNYKLNSVNNSVKYSFCVGLVRHDISEKRISDESNFFYHSPYLATSIAGKTFQVNGDFRFVISDSQKNNNSSIHVEAVKCFQNNFINSINLALKNSSLDPTSISSNYSSNHFKWKNNFSKEKMSSIYLHLNILNNHFSLFSQFTSYNNWVYYDQVASPSQLKGNNYVLENGVFFKTAIKKFSLQTNFICQYSNNNIIRVPDYKIYGRISIKDYFFKRALLAEFGLSCIYSSGYKANAYMPATGQYYLQDNQKIGNVPVINLFGNFVIGSATLFLKLENFGNNLIRGINFAIPDYPNPPRTFKLGIVWLLKN